MKKAQKARREFEKISGQLAHLTALVRNTKDSKLWDHEASVRKKIKALQEMAPGDFTELDTVYNGYLALLDDISARLLAHYNKKKRTDYTFEEIVKTDRAGYLASGIMSVLFTSHIPKMIQDAFNSHFPANPKDEYENARKMRRHVVLHLGETNTGKTYRAIERLKQADNGVYLAPLRILALENFERLNQEGVPCHLVTGEEEILVTGARHVCSTIEKLDLDVLYDVAVIDEVQMIADGQRGFAWTRAVLGLQSTEIHICGAFNAKALLLKILGDCRDDVEIIEYRRNTPLEVCSAPFSLQHAQRGDALVAFSKRRVLELSKYYQERGVHNSVIYGDLPPEVRRMQYHAFIQGDSKLLITTDAIGMGVNLPIRRIIFTDLMKFDGEEKRYITSQEVKQIAGRAGRRGIYDVGYVCTTGVDFLFLKENLETADEPLIKAVLGPGEAIMRIQGLPLRDKLALWSTSAERLDYYRKMDVRDYLLILDSIRPFRLPEKAEFQLMKLPFNVRDAAILADFLEHVETCFIKKEAAINKPKAAGQTLADFERYYQKLGLYYAFSKNFNLSFEPEWVYAERAATSEKINRLLLKL
ncbi:RNA helicase [Oscillospiraceae bacterium CM]|nr:RNA helicase [Oscillospiraceae bacterium CM]